MHAARRAIALDPRRFGRGPLRDIEPSPEPSLLNEDLKLFVTTFAAGFVFISVLLA